MNTDLLAQSIEKLSQPGKGILAADESQPTIAKRFAAVNVEPTEQNRAQYRALLADTAGLERYISGVILFEETLTHTVADGRTIPTALSDMGIVPGIKVDKGLVPVEPDSIHKLTQGLDGLAERLQTYGNLGARFAKWRNVYRIGDALLDDPQSRVVVTMGAEILARYAALCQQNGLVPIVEPEVLMDGDHDLARCANTTLEVQTHVFAALRRHSVDLRYILLKPNMVVPGDAYAGRPPAPEEIAVATVDVLRQSVPAAVPGINFLSGGLSETDASAYLQAINAYAQDVGAPWQLSFSYGRALQATVLATWQGSSDNVASAQAALMHRSAMNSSAVRAEYTPALENS